MGGREGLVDTAVKTVCSFFFFFFFFWCFSQVLGSSILWILSLFSFPSPSNPVVSWLDDHSCFGFLASDLCFLAAGQRDCFLPNLAFFWIVCLLFFFCSFFLTLRLRLVICSVEWLKLWKILLRNMIRLFATLKMQLSSSNMAMMVLIQSIRKKIIKLWILAVFLIISLLPSHFVMKNWWLHKSWKKKWKENSALPFIILIISTLHLHPHPPHPLHPRLPLHRHHILLCRPHCQYPPWNPCPLHNTPPSKHMSLHSSKLPKLQKIFETPHEQLLPPPPSHHHHRRRRPLRPHQYTPHCSHHPLLHFVFILPRGMTWLARSSILTTWRNSSMASCKRWHWEGRTMFPTKILSDEPSFIHSFVGFPSFHLRPWKKNERKLFLLMLFFISFVFVVFCLRVMFVCLLRSEVCWTFLPLPPPLIVNLIVMIPWWLMMIVVVFLFLSVFLLSLFFFLSLLHWRNVWSFYPPLPLLLPLILLEAITMTRWWLMTSLLLLRIAEWALV